MPKIIDTKRYRKELLNQCFEILAEKGYANVTTRQLSEFLRISTGALYHYFPSKKALFEQLVFEIADQDVQMLQTVAENAKTLPERIILLGQLLIEHKDYFVNQAALWVDFYRQTDKEEISSNAVLKRINQQYQSVMMRILDVSEPKIAVFVWTLINGVLLEQVEGETEISFAEQIDLLTKMLTAYFDKYQP